MFALAELEHRLVPGVSEDEGKVTGGDERRSRPKQRHAPKAHQSTHQSTVGPPAHRASL